MKKTLLITAMTFALTGVAFADDAPAGGDPTTAAPPAGATPTTGTPAMAGDAKKKTIGADLVVALPFGDYADAVSFDVGALGRFEFPINGMLSITGRAGFIYNLAKEIGGTTPTIFMIPILAGVSYKIGTSGLFVDGEIGFNYVHVAVGDISDSQTKLTFQAGPGYQKGKIEARAGFWYTATDGSAFTALMASVGFNFASM